jgi:cytochrome b subunit of formate dehydrogenase
VGWLALSLLSAKTRACVPFHLKTEDGKIINPLTGENADQPYSSREVQVPAGRLNAGQKIFLWLTMGLTLIMGVAGILLIFKTSLPLTFNCLISTIHGVFAIIFVAPIIAHAYLGTIANPGTFSAIVTGKVSRK